MLYWRLAPKGEVILMPETATQLGWVMLAVGAKGLAGIGFTVTGVPEEMQPVTISRTVIE